MNTIERADTASNAIRYAQRTPPVLLITFNRPKHTATLLARIQEAQPPALYVACDGPRPGREDDVANVRAIQEMARRIDWCSNVKTLFCERNLGCGRGESEAMTWFLQDAGEGIILEDDTLPDLTFFRFCGEMLDRYRNTSNVMQVAGYNLLSGRYDPGTDYFFSHFGWQWGWATWKRAFDHYDPDMMSWPEFKRLGYHRAFPFYPLRVRTLDAEYANQFHGTWDYQWHYAIAANSGLSVVPRYSLIENIGFGPEATHANNAGAEALCRVPVRPMVSPPTHSAFVYADPAYDRMLVKWTHRKPWYRHLWDLACLARAWCLRRSAAHDHPPTDVTNHPIIVWTHFVAFDAVFAGKAYPPRSSQLWEP